MDFHDKRNGNVHDLSMPGWNEQTPKEWANSVKKNAQSKADKPTKAKKHEHEFDAPGMQDGPCVVGDCNAYIKRSMADNGKWTSEVKEN
jgi:hypothetical protein